MSFSREARSIEQAAIFVNTNLNLAGNGEPERVPAARVSASLFGVLACSRGSGGFSPLTRIAPEPRVFGRRVIINGIPQTISGVMPPGFQIPDGPELPIWAGAKVHPMVCLRYE
jgi:hypothetical protein